EGRALEWRDNANASVPIVSDRLANVNGSVEGSQVDTHQSIWNPASQAGAWNGAVGFADGHIERVQSSEIEAGGIIVNGISNTRGDNIFSPGDGAFQGVSSSVATRQGLSAHMAVRAATQTVLVAPGP
ncbi:MAG: hypothetical protein AAF078_10750, partial [Planctomycetota bacterium]